MKIQKLILILAVGTLMSGCQTETTTETKIIEENKTPVIDHGIPESTGPTGAPNVKGPTSPPPESNVLSDLSPQAEAVTTSENIRLTLPLKTETK